MPALLALALAACAHRPPPPPDPAAVTFTRLAPDVWMHTSLRELPAWGLVPSNGLIVVDGETSILVDTAWDDAQTAQILAWAAADLGRPITRAVFTHAHDDKMGGVAAVKAAGAETWAHPASNAAAPDRGLVPAARDLAFDADGTSSALAPLIVFDPGPAHTADNVVVAAPAAGVLFGGCMVRPGGAADLGNTADADVPHWAAAIEAVEARFGDLPIVVPSHGPPGGPALLAATRALAEAAD